MIDLLQWIGAILGMLGAPLVASRSSRVRCSGFGVWIGSNVALISWASITGAWGLVAMQAFFCWSSWRGWMNNRKPINQG